MNRTIAQAYCPGLLPSTIACLILSTYIEITVSNLTWGPLLEFFLVVLPLVFFFWNVVQFTHTQKKWGVKVGNWTTKHRSSSFGSTLASHEIFESVQNFPSVVSAQCTRALSLYKGIVITVQERERERKSDGRLSVTAQTLLSLTSVLQWVESKSIRSRSQSVVYRQAYDCSYTTDWLGADYAYPSRSPYIVAKQKWLGKWPTSDWLAKNASL